MNVLPAEAGMRTASPRAQRATVRSVDAGLCRMTSVNRTVRAASAAPAGLRPHTPASGLALPSPATGSAGWIRLSST